MSGLQPLPDMMGTDMRSAHPMRPTATAAQDLQRPYARVAPSPIKGMVHLTVPSLVHHKSCQVQPSVLCVQPMFGGGKFASHCSDQCP